MLTTTRSYWTATRIFYAVVAGLWLTFTVALLVALLHGSGVSHRVLMPVLVSGGVLLLGLTIVAANLPRPGPPPGGQVHRRPARVGGRPFGEGLGAATRRAPVVENRVVDHVYITRADLKETTARMAVVPSGQVAVGVAPVVVVDEPAAAVDAAVEMVTEAEARGHFWGQLDGFNQGVMSVQDPSLGSDEPDER